MSFDIGAYKQFGAVSTLSFGELAAIFLLILLQWVCVKVIFKLSQLSLPLAALGAINTLDFELVQRPSQSFVWEAVGYVGLATGAEKLFLFDFLNAHLTEAISTAGNLVGLSENLQTHWTVTLNCSRRLLYKFTIKSTEEICHDFFHLSY